MANGAPPPPGTNYGKNFNIGNLIPAVIDEVRVSKVARYEKEFSPPGRFTYDPDTVALYHCDDGGGDVLTDSSPNNIHGKLYNATFERIDPPAMVTPLPPMPIPMAETGPADLLARLKKEDIPADVWKLEVDPADKRPVLVSEASPSTNSKCRIKHVFPTEYDLVVEVIKPAAGSGVQIKVPAGDRTVGIDIKGTGVAVRGNAAEPFAQSADDTSQALNQKQVVLGIRVRKDSLQIVCQGQTQLNYRGDFKEFPSVQPDERNSMLLITSQQRYVFKRLEVRPVK
jgi:hypothetical protein